MIPPYHLLFLTILTTSTATIPQNPNPTGCPLSNCGNNTISYPFWLINDTRTNYCGYRGFDLSCSNNQTVLRLPNNDSYYVQNIDYTKFTLSLVDIDVTTSNCPRVRHNFTLGASLFNSSIADQNLSFFFNCSDYPSSAVPLPCLEHDGRNSVYVLDQVPDFDWEENCEENVVVPILKQFVVDLMRTMDFGGALRSGFQLDWISALDCSSCEESGGYCGYDESSLEFLCFCNNGVHDKNCYGSTSKI